MKSLKLPSDYRLGYRSDIEGLRAIAILLVVAAHARVSWLAGGFVGVDVFFVLSGYLITGLLIQEISATGDLRFAAFYARRIRRLMPALMLMLLCVCLLGWQLLIPIAQLGQAKAAGGAAVWFSNFYFALAEMNYFAPDSKSNLFLHTWSLGVEEQFYVVWPLLMVLLTGAWQGAKKPPQADRLKIAMPVIFVLSLALCLWWSKNSSLLAFYMMPSRAWQFALGALVFVYFGAPKVQGEERLGLLIGNRTLIGAGWLGLVLIVFAAIFLNHTRTYPGAWALLPSFGAALVIAAGAISAKWGVERLLSLRLMQGIGRISYSWYLWHWPVLLLGATVIDMHSGLHRFGLVVLSFIIAVVSYRYVEAPIRHKKFIVARPRLAVVSGLTIMVLAGLLTVPWYQHDISQLKSPEQARFLRAEWDAPVIYNMGCDDWYFSSDVKLCIFGNNKAAHTAVIVGDSIGMQWFPAVREIYKTPDWRLLAITKSSCPMVDEPLFYPRINRIYKNCSIWRKNVFDELRKIKPDVVIMGSTYTYDYTKQQWISGTKSILAELSETAKQVYILRSTPILPFDGPACLTPHSQLFNLLAGKRTCSGPAYDSRSDEVYAWLETAASDYSNVRTVDMTGIVCPDARCEAQRNGEIIFRDNQHMTATFAKSLGQSLEENLQQSLNHSKSSENLSGR